MSQSPHSAGAANVYTIVFDGGSLGNPGKGYGSYLLKSPTGKEIHEAIEFPESDNPMTNNQAEYRTLIAALEHLARILGDRSVTASVRIEGDSQLVLNQVQGKWKVKNAGLQPLHKATRSAIGPFQTVTYAWHPRSRSVKILGH